METIQSYCFHDVYSVQFDWMTWNLRTIMLTLAQSAKWYVREREPGTWIAKIGTGLIVHSFKQPSIITYQPSDKLITRGTWATSFTRETVLIKNTFAQSHDYTLTLIRRGKKTIISFLRMEWSLFVKTCVPFIQTCSVSSLVKIGTVVLENKILKFCQCIFAISFLSPLEKQTWIPFTHVCVVLSLIEIGQVVQEKKMKLWKVYDDNNNATTTKTTDNRQISIRKAETGSGELKIRICSL